jgi:hypothetical protein
MENKINSEQLIDFKMSIGETLFTFLLAVNIGLIIGISWSFGKFEIFGVDILDFIPNKEDQILPNMKSLLLLL